MFFKIALRNVKRQMGNYLIYFITVAMTVSLIFSVNNVIFSRQMIEKAETMENLASGLIIITVFVSLIVAFVLGYATSFMLKLRKKEFGTYLTLGMTRKNILSVFIAETMFMCITALAAGIGAGLFIYQAMMAFITKLMEIDITMADYSVKGLILTIILVLGVFVLSSLTSAFYLKNVKIYDLIYGDRHVKRSVRYPALWMTFSLCSLAAMAVSLVMFNSDAKSLIKGMSSGNMMIVSIVVFALSLIVFHIAASKSIVNIMLKNKRFCSKGTNTFTLRQLSGKLNSNAVIAGIISFLIAFAIIGANVAFCQKISDELSIEKNYPFDITLMKDSIRTGDGISPISVEEGERIIEKYNDIEKKIPYVIYDTGNNYLHGFTKWSGQGYEGLNDTVISESDFNRLWTALGNRSIELNGEFMIVPGTGVQVESNDFSHAELSLGGKLYKYKGMIENAKVFMDYFTAVVPDEAVKGLDIEGNCISYTLKNERYDAVSMHGELSYEIREESGGVSYNYLNSQYDIKEYERIDRNNFSAVFVTGALYIAVVFILMAMAVIALKTLSGINEDKRRYSILFQLGAGEKQQCRSLFRQIFSFFFLPFALPVIMSFPVSYLCAEIMQMAGIDKEYTKIYMISFIITIAAVIIYTLYFMATYLVAKRNVISRQKT